MTKKIKNFIFDIDGTLIDTLDMYMPAMIEVLRKHGYSVAPEDEENVMHRLFGITGVDALRLYGVKKADIKPLAQEWFKLAYQREDRVKILPGIPTALQKLADQGRNLAVATSKLQSEYKHFQQEFTFAKFFKTVITSDDTTKHKPDPEPILAAMKKMGAQEPNQTVYVGDTINDLKAAQAAGVKFAGALYGSANPDSIKDADFPLTTPADLLKL
ncbi:HAD family hydrolase [Limosilactobacillus sp.]|jgi:HAD superfamily hydrolase (TIGR01662 family)|uniref:HAD family hydrolase n=1 Tax=Limosilactobacillus sp. TaxID=2773925 RepID=UPI00359FE9D1